MNYAILPEKILRFSISIEIFCKTFLYHIIPKLAMNTQIVIASVIAAILVVGFVSTTVTVFADSNQVKQSNKANIHIKGDNNVALIDQDNVAATVP
jgi:hypothetical protein